MLIPTVPLLLRTALAMQVMYYYASLTRNLTFWCSWTSHWWSGTAQQNNPLPSIPRTNDVRPAALRPCQTRMDGPLFIFSWIVDGVSLSGICLCWRGSTTFQTTA